MRIKKVVAGILLTVIVLENSLTALASPVANIEVVTETEGAVEESSVAEEGEGSVSETTGEEAAGEEMEGSETVGEEVSSEELTSVEAETTEEIVETESVYETITAEENITETDEEVTEVQTTEVMADNSAMLNVMEEEQELDYILGRPMTAAESAKQEALVPDYLPPLELMPMEGMSDIDAGLNKISLFSTASSLPEKYDSRDADIITSVKDQNPWGTCWSFATMALMESSWLQQFNETIDLSERHLAYFVKNTGYDPLGNASEDTIVPYNESFYLQSGGNLYKSAAKLMNWHGAASETDYPYSNSNTVPAAIAAENAQDIIAYPKNVFFIPTKNATQEEKVTTVKKLIQTYGCVEWSYMHSADFYNTSTGAYYVDTAYLTNHSITVVGWDDTYSKNNFRSSMQPENDGAWIVKNSWGETFGHDGYMYISYEDKSLGSGNPVAVITAGDAQDYDNNYFYGNIVSNSYLQPIQSVSNVYTINGETAKQKIKAVSFMVAQEKQTYSIQLYKNPARTDGVVTNPASGTALLDEPVIGEVGYTGLYTVEIPEVTVELDDCISVVVTFGSAGLVYFTSSTQTSFTDGSIALTEVNVTTPGESFYNGSTNANGWKDGANNGYSFLVNLLTENVSETVTTPSLTYTVSAPVDFSDTIACNLKWVKCSNALRYELYRAESVDGNYGKIADISASNRTYQDNIALADRGKTFYYKLVAVYANDVVGESEGIAVDLSTVQLVPEIDFKQYMNFTLLEWEEMNGAAGYIIEKKTADGAAYSQLADIKTGSELVYIDKDVELFENVYEYRIRAYTVEGSYSDWKEWSTTDVFCLSQIDSKNVSVQWKKVQGATYYRLLLGNVRWNITTPYSVSDLEYSGTVGDVVRCNIQMYSSQAAYENGEEALCTSSDIYYYSVPDSLTNLKSSWDGEKASFSWDATTTADTIKIYRSMDAEDMGESAYTQVEGTATAYEDSGFAESGTYYYWFEPQKANSAGEMIAGETVLVQLDVEVDNSVEPVDLLSVTEKTESSVEITWEKHGLADGYSVYRKASGDSKYEGIASIIDPEQVTYVDETVVIGKIYEYKVALIIEDVEYGLESAETMQVQTRPAAPVLLNAKMASVEIKNNPDLEYAAVESGASSTSKSYESGTGATLVLSNLSENTAYDIYARTKTSVTGNESVYSNALAVSTKAVDTVAIEVEKNSLVKGETTKILTTIAAGEETESYAGDISWSVETLEGQACNVTSENGTTIVSGMDGKEIVRIVADELTATASSEIKAITLTGEFTTSSGRTLLDEVSITIAVPLEKLQLNIESVNGIASDSLEGIGIGDTAVLSVTKEPFNADPVTLQWKSMNESVAVIMPDSEDDNKALLEITGLGTTLISVQTMDGTVKSELEVNVTLDPVVMLSAKEKTPVSIEINWEKHNAAEVYKVYRKDKGAEIYNLITTITGNEQTSYEDLNVLTGKTYYYKVTAVRDGVESDINVTKEVSGRTAPSIVTLVENGITHETITINSITGLEYAITSVGIDKTTLVYTKSDADTLVFDNLEPNTAYVIYVRTDSEITGEAAVYGPVLNVSTFVKAEMFLSIKDVVLSKGNKLPFSYTIIPDNLHYNDSLAWSAADAEGNSYEIITMGTDTVVINGTDSKEICRISNGSFYATGESTQKDVYITVKRGSLEALFHVKINVPVMEMQMQVISVDEDTLVTTLDDFHIGQKAQLELSVLPVNTEETVIWSSSNEKVASVKATDTKNRQAEVTAEGIGSCDIMAVSSDGVKTTMTVTVKKVSPLYGIWVSEKTDLSGTLVEKDPVTGEYISEGLEKQPVFALNDTTATTMTVVSYILDDENGGTVRLAEEADGIVYRSSDPSVVSVTQDGTITAAGSGEADIIAYESKGNGIYGSCQVIVTAQNTEKPTADGYPLDKKIKLSAVSKNLNIESFALDEKSSCEVLIKDQYGKVYSTQQEKQLFAYSSAKPSICMVDENGVVRPNPTYTGKTASVKVTAVLKGDKAGRKVIFTIKLLAEKQIDRISLECMAASENAEVSDTKITEVFEKGGTLTFAVTAYDSKSNIIEKPKLKFAVSDTKVAKVKDNKNGTVTVTLLKAGRANLNITGNDVWKKTASVQIVAADTKPYLSKTTLSMNAKLVSAENDGWRWKASEDISIRMPDEASLKSVKITGASVGKKNLSETELTNLAWVENEDGTYHIAAKESYIKSLSKNTKISVKMQAEVESAVLNATVTEDFVVTVKVTSQDPKITVSEAKSINRFYTDKDETLLILKAPSIITKVEVLNSEYFTVTELKRGQWYLEFRDPSGTYNAKKTTLMLRLTADGYEPVEKKLTVQTPYKAPTLKQQTVPVLHVGNEQFKQAEIVLYDKTNKMELSGYEIKSFTASKLEDGSENGFVVGSSFYINLKEESSFKNNEKPTAQISVQAQNWAAPVSMKVSVKVSTKIPKITLSSGKITLNAQAPAEKTAVTLSADQKNIGIHSREDWELQMYDASAKEWFPVAEEFENDWLTVSYDVTGRKMFVGIRADKIVTGGNYKVRVKNVLEDFEEVYKDFTVKVVDVKPTVTVSVKGKQDLIDRAAGSLTGTLKFKNAIAAKTTDVVILSEDGKAENTVFKAQLLPNGKFSIRFTEEGMKDASLKKQKVTLPVAVTMENGTVIHGSVRFSLSQSNPKVKVPAMQTIYKSMMQRTREYDFASGLADGVMLDKIDVVSVPKGFSASYKDGSVVVTLNDRGIKAGTYQIKANLYFEGAAEGTKPVSKTIKVKVAE